MMDYIIGKTTHLSSTVLLALVDMKMRFSQRLLHDLLFPQHHESLVYTGKRINMARKHLDLIKMLCNDVE